MESNLGLVKELSWVLQLDSLMVLMKSDLRVNCLDLEYDNMLILQLVLLVAIWMDIIMA